MSTKELKFICPECGCKKLEEIMTGVIQSYSIDSIFENGVIDFPVNGGCCEGGEVDCYECRDCGYILKTEHNCNINGEEELVQWLKRNCNQE